MQVETNAYRYAHQVNKKNTTLLHFLIGTLPDSSTPRVCLGCDGCLTCANVRTECTSCTDDLYLKSNTCVSDCLDGYYQNNNLPK